MRIIGLAYAALGLIQLGMWWVSDRLAVRIVAGASLLFIAGSAAQAALQGTASTDTFHQIGLGAAAGGALIAVLYAALPNREGQTATA